MLGKETSDQCSIPQFSSERRAIFRIVFSDENWELSMSALCPSLGFVLKDTDPRRPIRGDARAIHARRVEAPRCVSFARHDNYSAGSFEHGQSFLDHLIGGL